MPAGFTIKGIEPYELRQYPPAVNLMYWSWVKDLVLQAKDSDLAQGFDAFGEPLHPISEYTRKHRKSAMTPSGKGDPWAPPLTPGYALSRTRSLLAARALVDRVEVWWRFDPFTHASWSKILTYQKENQDRDVFGLSPAATEWVQMRALGNWRAWLRSGAIVPAQLEGKRVIPPMKATGTEGPAVPAVMPGRPIGPTAVFGIGRQTAAGLKPGEWSGGFTEAELKAYFRQPAPAAVQARPGTYNRLLAHIWGKPAEPFGVIEPIVITPPPPRPPRPRPAPKPKPIPIPKPPESVKVKPVKLFPPKPAALTPAPIQAETFRPSMPPPPRDIKAELDAWALGDQKVKAIQDLASKTEVKARGARFRQARDDLADYTESLKTGDRRKKAVREKLAELTAEHEDADRWAFRTAERTREEIFKILKADNPATSQLTQVDVVPNSRISTEITKGKDWILPLVNDPSQSLDIKINADTPAGLNRARGGYTSIHMSLTNDARTVVHEIGHTLEDQLPGTIAAEKQFLEYRAKGQARKKFKDIFPANHYDDSEEGVDDEFGKYFSPANNDERFGETAPWYVGKYYANRSELLSMGLEALHEDGIEFATKDAEYAKFVIAILHGVFH